MSLFVFNNQQKLMKSIPNRDLISVVQDQAINVSDTLFVEMPADIWSNLKEPASYLAVQDPYNRFSYHMYKVSKHTTKADTTDVEAIQVGYDELKAYGYIKDRRFNNRPVLEAATAIVDGTDWQLGYIDANLPNVNTNFYYVSRLEALSKLIEATGAEVRFRIEISGNKIIAKRLDLYKQLGTFKGKRFAYGSNLLEIIKEEDTSELYTALVGRGKGEETATGGFGRRITFADIVWSKAGGDPVDKPLGQEFIELPEMTAYYGYPDGEPRTGIVEFSDIKEPEQVIKATYDRLVEISRPQVQFKAKVQTTGDMQLGEEVAIIRSGLGFRYKTRVFRVKRDYLNNMFTEVELGDKLTESLASRIKKIDTTINRQEQTLIQVIQTAANGKNKIFRGPVEPTEGMMVNDLWYKPIGEGETEMYQFDGAYWQLILSTLDTTKVQHEVEAAQAAADSAKQEAITGKQEAIEEAERLVQAQTEAFDTQMFDVNQEINTVKTNIDTTISNVNQEIVDNFTSLSNSISGVNGIANQAKTDAQTGITNAATALSQANSAIGNAQVAQQNALTALSKADSALGGLSSLDVRVDDVEAEVALKADNTFITEDGVLTTLSNAITVNANRFSSDMQRIESRVESLSGEINLVILKDAFENKWLLGDEVYPNATTSAGTDTMREMINVVAGERLALSKDTIGGDNAWRISFYNNVTYVTIITSESNQYVMTVPAGVNKMWVSYPSGCRPQIVRGSTFVPYRPNIADQMTTDEMVLFRNEYDEFADKTVRRLTAIDSSGGRLETAELLINQTADGLALKADETTVNTLTGRLSTAEGQITAQAGQIALRVTEVQAKSIADAAVVGLEIGGRNYLKGSNDTTFNSSTPPVLAYTNKLTGSLEFLPEGYISHLTVRVGGSHSQSVFNNETVGLEFTASFEIKSNNPAPNNLLFYTGLDTNYIPVKGATTITPKWQRVYVTAEWTGGSWLPHIQGFSGGNVYEIRNFMVEKGNTVGDWKHATEDTMELISAVSSELKIEKDNITALLTRTTDNETAINQVTSTADGTEQTVANHAGRLTTVETNVSGLQVSVADKISNAQFTVLSTSVNSVVSNLSNTDIKARMASGRHLATDTVFEKGYNGIVKYANTNQQNVSITRRTTVGYSVPTDSPWMLWIEVIGETNPVFGGIYRPINGRANAEFVVKFTALLPIGRVFNNVSTGLGNGGSMTWLTSNVGTGKWTEYMYHVKHGSGAVGGFGYLYVSGGATPTPSSPLTWLLAKYETIDISSSNQSQITQLSDQINLRVAKGDVVSQINIEAGRTLIQSNSLVLDGNTIVNGSFVVSGGNVTLDGNTRVQGGFIVSGGNVILDGNTTVLGDFSVFGKNIILDGNTTVLGDFTVSGDIVGKGIRADNITVGNLDAANVNIINLNVSNLVGDTSDFVSSAWNSAAGGNVKVTSEGVVANASNGSQALLQNGVLLVRGTDGISTGYVGFSQDGSNNNFTLTTANGRSLQMRYSNGDGTFSPLIEYLSYLDSLYFGKRAVFQSTVEMNGNLNMKQKQITEVQKLRTGILETGNIGSVLNDTDNRIVLKGTSGAKIGVGGQVDGGFTPIIMVDSTRAYIYRNLSMEGNDITNQSDERLKENIVDSDYDGLGLFREIEPKNFTWKNKERFGLQTELGFIAQQLASIDPEIVTQTPDDDAPDGVAWAINETQMNRRAWIATHQLVKENDALKQEMADLKATLSDKGLI